MGLVALQTYAAQSHGVSTGLLFNATPRIKFTRRLRSTGRRRYLIHDGLQRCWTWRENLSRRRASFCLTSASAEHDTEKQRALHEDRCREEMAWSWRWSISRFLVCKDEGSHLIPECRSTSQNEGRHSSHSVGAETPTRERICCE